VAADEVQEVRQGKVQVQGEVLMATFVKCVSLASTTVAYQALNTNLNHSITFISVTANNVVLDVLDTGAAMTAITNGDFVLIPANTPVRIECANPSRVFINPSAVTTKMSMIFGD
jgi:hypothetical protein